jgi:hypothetical protein
MVPAPVSPASASTLQAFYTSPTSSQTFSHPLPSASVTSTEEKTAFLSALRNSIVQLQEDVNGFLTTKMAEDKAMAASAGMKADDKAEEENYGEERVEDEG